MCTFYQRVRARRGHQIAIVAVARKLASLLWCLLAREQDYAYGQPSLTRQKIRRLELAAGAPPRKRQPGVEGGERNHPVRDLPRLRPPVCADICGYPGDLAGGVVARNCRPATTRFVAQR